MKPYHYLQTILVFCLLHLASYSFSQRNSHPPQPAVYQQKMQSSTLLFMENKGQVADEKGNPQPNILFTANSGGAKIYLTTNGIHYQFSKTEYPKGYDPFSKELNKDPQQQEALRKQIKTSTHRFTVELQGANPHPVVSKQGQSNYYENYYLAQCPDGITGVHGYEKIIYKNVYPNIDWVVYSKGGFMEYDFLVYPGGNPASIKLKIKDADKVSITPQGELLMKTSLGEVREKAPVSYADGRLIPSHFKQNNDGTIGFAVQPQPDKELRIDPSIVWSTYYGGSGGETMCYTAVDNSNNVYLAGATSSATGIASGGFQNTLAVNGLYDGFIVKFDATGSRLWGTYYGGTSNELSYAVTTDASGNVFLLGETDSDNGIASGGFQTVFGGTNDAFLVKFNSNGNRLWSTYYGGPGLEYARDCCTDANGNVYIAGTTQSVTNIALGGFQNTNAGYQDAYLVKFSASGNRVWGTYYGGTMSDQGSSCSVDNVGGFVYLAGTATSDGVAYQGFKNTKEGPTDNFLVKFAIDGPRIWATYYGGESEELTGLCRTDPFGNVYLAGATPSLTNIAFNGCRNTNSGSADFYLVKFTSSGSRLWATYYGGNSVEMDPFLICDAAGNTYLSGITTSYNGINVNGIPNYQLFPGFIDAFLVKFETTGNCLWATYFGGTNLDRGTSCASDYLGNVYLSGYTSSSGLGINGFQNNLVGAPYDDFLVKISTEPLCIAATQPTISAINDTICAGNGTSLSITSGNLNSATTWQWRKDSCNGAVVGTGTNINVFPTATTTYFVRGEGGCAASGNCTSKTIVVNPAVTASVALTANPAGPITAGTTVTFTATAINGGTAPVYSFRINNVIVQSGTSNTYTTNNLVNGDNVLVIMRSNMPCVTNAQIDSPPITIVVATPCIAPTTPTISTNYDTVCTGATPTLTITSGNLNSATHWQWYTDSCGGTPVGNTSSITFTPTVTTTYYVRGEGGCVTPGNCTSRTIYVKPKPTVTFTAFPSSVCAGDTITVTFTGTAPANAIYQWYWGGGTVVSGTNTGPYRVIYDTIGNINLSVSNGTCSVVAATQIITTLPKPTADFRMSDTIGCGQILLYLYNKSLNATSFYWTFGDNSYSTDANPFHPYSKGLYTIALTASNSTCSHTITQTLRVVDKPLASFSALPTPNIPVPVSGALFSFINTSQNASSYRWQFGDLGTSTLVNPSHKYNNAGYYAVKLYAYNTANCADSSEVKPFTVIADTIPAFTIPNAFSPNKDGINDTWMMKGLQESTNCKVTIYNRWGQSIFVSTGYSKPWDGTYNGKPLPVDTYYYIITTNGKNYTGSVTLLR